MPTGYTAQLQSSNYDIKTWLKEVVVRNFGITMSMRDDGDLTEQEIKDNLNKDSYHKQKLAKCSKELICEYKRIYTIGESGGK